MIELLEKRWSMYIHLRVLIDECLVEFENLRVKFIQWCNLRQCSLASKRFLVDCIEEVIIHLTDVNLQFVPF